MVVDGEVGLLNDSTTQTFPENLSLLPLHEKTDVRLYRSCIYVKDYYQKCLLPSSRLKLKDYYLGT